MARKKAINPFYVVLVVVGAAFAVTASAYGVTAMRALRTEPGAAAESESQSSLPVFMSKYGNPLLLIELVILAVATVGAIATDDYWTKRAQAASESSAENKP